MHVRYYCHFTDTGYSRAALEYALGLSRHPDIHLDIRPIGTVVCPDTVRQRELAPLFFRHHPYPTSTSGQQKPDIVLVHTLPRDCAEVIRIETEAGNLSAGVPAVAYTTWEALTLPKALYDSLLSFDSILTPSEASAKPLAYAVGRNNVYVVPHGYEVAEHCRIANEAEEKDLGSDFVFYYIGAMNRRKNVEGLVRAFASAFGMGDGAHLVLHCPGASVAQFKLMIAGTGFPDLPITLRNEYVSDVELATLHESADCFVTASRGEAWGLGSFEAMLHGRNVIAPADQGSDEYLVGTDAKRYGWTPAPAALGVEATMVGANLKVTTNGPTCLTSRDRWHEPRLDFLAELMQIAATGQQSILRCPPRHLERFTQERVTQDLVQALEKTLNDR